MATESVRWQAYCDAMTNQSTSLAICSRLAVAYCTSADRISEYNAAGTNNAKARIALDVARRFAIDIVKATEASAAGNSAAQAAADDAESSLPESP